MKRRARVLIWGFLVVWGTVLSAELAARRVWPTDASANGPSVGAVLPLADSVVTTIDSVPLRLVARNQKTAILLVTAECPACRSSLPVYHALDTALQRSGIAFRIAVSSAVANVHVFARDLPRQVPVIADPGYDLMRSLNIRVIPTLLLIDSVGLVSQTFDPRTRQIQYALRQMERAQNERGVPN